MKVIAEVAIVIGLIGIFVLTFLLNKKTPLPKGVTEEDIAKCAGCSNKTCKKRLTNESIECKEIESNEE